MAKIAFFAENMAERGTAVAIYDYARYCRDLLGHEPAVLYLETFSGNNPQVVKKFTAAFETIPCQSFADADVTIAREQADLLHVLKSGHRDEIISVNAPTMVQCVFPNSLREAHGASYAYISDWLAQHCSGGALPYVPHIVTIDNTDENLRSELGIPEDALVFGCYGGKDSFDIEFVKSTVIPEVLEHYPSIWFAFMNIAPFISHKRVVFRPGSVDMGTKAAFINACDAMLHGRKRGETFGLAVGEFSLRDKPVLTYGRSRERAHLDALGSTAQIYNSADDLFNALAFFDRTAVSAKSRYKALFSPEQVMARFSEHLVDPATRFGISDTQNRLGFSRWNPLLLARPRLSKFLSKRFM